MKYEHNEVHDKTVGVLVRQKYDCTKPVNFECGECAFFKFGCDDKFKKRQRVIEYIAEEVAELWGEQGWGSDDLELCRWGIYEWGIYKHNGQMGEKYPVDKQTAKEIADAARVLLEGDEVVQEKQFELKEDQPKIADAFYVYDDESEKCVTVSHEHGDNCITLLVHKDMTIETAKVFSEKLASFLQSIGGGK